MTAGWWRLILHLSERNVDLAERLNPYSLGRGERVPPVAAAPPEGQFDYGGGPTDTFLGSTS